MTHEATRFAIVPIYADSTGCEVKFPDAIMTGEMSAVMARIKDSRQMREDLRVSNEADKVRRAKAALRADTAAFEAEKAEFAADVESVRDVLIQEFAAKVDALAARVNSLETARAYDPDEDELPLPPLALQDPAPADSGDLRAINEAPPGPETKDEPEEQDPDLPRPPVAVEADHA